jgi:hypothetical protein
MSITDTKYAVSGEMQTAHQLSFFPAYIMRFIFSMVKTLRAAVKYHLRMRNLPLFLWSPR